MNQQMLRALDQLTRQGGKGEKGLIWQAGKGEKGEGTQHR